MNTIEIDWNSPGWIKLTLWQHIRLLYAKHTASYIGVYASNGRIVEACPEFVEQHWKCPGLYQELIDSQALREKMIHDY